MVTHDGIAHSRRRRCRSPRRRLPQAGMKAHAGRVSADAPTPGSPPAATGGATAPRDSTSSSPTESQAPTNAPGSRAQGHLHVDHLHVHGTGAPGPSSLDAGRHRASRGLDDHGGAPGLVRPLLFSHHHLHGRLQLARSSLASQAPAFGKVAKNHLLGHRHVRRGGIARVQQETTPLVGSLLLSGKLHVRSTRRFGHRFHQVVGQVLPGALAFARGLRPDPPRAVVQRLAGQQGRHDLAAHRSGYGQGRGAGSCGQGQAGWRSRQRHGRRARDGDQGRIAVFRGVGDGRRAGRTDEGQGLRRGQETGGARRRESRLAAEASEAREAERFISTAGAASTTKNRQRYRRVNTIMAMKRRWRTTTTTSKNLTTSPTDSHTAMDAAPAGRSRPPGGGASHASGGSQSSGRPAVTAGRPDHGVDRGVHGAAGRGPSSSGVAPSAAHHGLDGTSHRIDRGDGGGPASARAPVAASGAHHRADGVVDLGGRARADGSPGSSVVAAHGHGVGPLASQGASVHFAHTQAPAGVVARADENGHGTLEGGRAATRRATETRAEKR